jgi:hypothetical protein
MQRGLLAVVLLFGAVVLAAQHDANAAGPSPAASSSPAASPAPKGSAPITAGAARLGAMAPADAYFGSQGMSPLSIRSTIGFLGRQYHFRTISDRDLLRKALLTEEALRKWRTAYPADPWLSPTFYHLEQLYQAVQTQEARKHATAILKDVIVLYPSTKEGHLSRSRLAAGFPPLVPETPLVETPAPTAAPSPTPPNATEVSPLPGGSAVPEVPPAQPTPTSERPPSEPSAAPSASSSPK